MLEPSGAGAHATQAARFAGCRDVHVHLSSVWLVPRRRLSAACQVQAMEGFGGAPRAEAMNVAWDAWGMRVGLVSEDFVRTWTASM